MTKTSTIAGQVITLYKTSNGWASSPELAQAIRDRRDALGMELKASIRRDQFLSAPKENRSRGWRMGIEPDPYQLGLSVSGPRVGRI